MFCCACLERGGAKAEVEPEPPVTAPSSARFDASIQTPAEPPAEDVDRDAAIRVGLGTEPVHLNPLLDSVASQIAMGDIYQGLVCPRRQGTPLGACTTSSITVTDEGRRWRFVLDSKARFHNGKPVMPADVLESFRFVDPKTPAPSSLAAEFSDLISMKRVAPDAVEFHFGEHRMHRRQAFALVPIMPAKALAGVSAGKLATAQISRHPIGTGPYEFTQWKPGHSITLRRRGSEGYAATLVYRFIPSRPSLKAALSRGDVDLAPGIPAIEAEEIAKEPGLRLFRYTLPSFLAAVYNTRRAELSDPVVRAMMTRTLDPQSIVDFVLNGHGKTITGPAPPDGDNYDPRLIHSHYFPYKKTAEPRATLLVPRESQTMRRIADIWAAQAQDRLSVEVAPYAEVLTRMREHKFDIVLGAFTTGEDVDFFSLFHSSKVGSTNLSGIEDEKLDALLEELRRYSPDSKKQSWWALHRRLHDLQPFAFISTDLRLGIARAEFRGGEHFGTTAAGRYLWRSL